MEFSKNGLIGKNQCVQYVEMNHLKKVRKTNLVTDHMKLIILWFDKLNRQRTLSFVCFSVFVLFSPSTSSSLESITLSFKCVYPTSTKEIGVHYTLHYSILVYTYEQILTTHAQMPLDHRERFLDIINTNTANNLAATDVSSILSDVIPSTNGCCTYVPLLCVRSESLA